MPWLHSADLDFRDGTVFSRPGPILLLRSELDGTSQRAYGILGYLFPNAGPAERVATVNTLVSMLPMQVERFMQVLDQKQFAVQLLGLVPRPAVGHDSATAAVLQNRSVWNYVGSRFIVAPLDGFVDRILPGSVFEVRGGWPGDGSVPIALPARRADTAGNTWSIVCGGDDWEAVVVKLGTYNGAAAQGELDLELLGNREKVLASTHLAAARVQDAGFAMLFVGRPFCQANDTLRLQIEQRGFGPSGPVAVWVDRASTKLLHYGLIPAPPNASRTGSPGQFPLSKGVTGWLRCPVGTADEIRIPIATSPRPAGIVTAALRTMDGRLHASEQIRAHRGMAGIHIRLPAGLCEAETRLGTTGSGVSTCRRRGRNLLLRPSGGATGSGSRSIDRMTSFSVSWITHERARSSRTCKRRRASSSRVPSRPWQAGRKGWLPSSTRLGRKMSLSSKALPSVPNEPRTRKPPARVRLLSNGGR